jgi:transaldolase/glucose-6-phosphate isomerase
MVQENPLRRLEALGQSVWLDFIRRGMIASGELKQLVDEDGVSGVTSNPSIFENAIAGSHDYDDAIRALAREDQHAEEIYQALAVEDVQQAADLLRPVYDRTEGTDGFVSLEVSPHLAYNTDGTIEEARRLWRTVDRPNVLIKVPATPDGLPAIEQLVSEGINVNVTLLFGLSRYREVVAAYIAGLEARASQDQPLERIASIASFFLSRIDVLVDPMLEGWMREEGPKAELAARLHGQVAIASAKMAYQIYEEIFHSERFQRLASRGARPQWVLWASTSTKNPSYSDVKYAEALIGPDTINTMPLETLNAYRDHGQPALRLEEDLDQARYALRHLPELGIDLDRVAQQLEEEGVQKFVKPFDQLLQALEQECAAALTEQADRQVLSLNGYVSAVQERVASLEQQGFPARLWRKDPGLWKEDPEDQKAICNALGWLHVAEKMAEILQDLASFHADLRAAGFRHVVHMGMGGSSLAPLVFQHTFAPGQDSLRLTVLDTTDPATIRAIEREVPVEHTLFIVASKSGTTTEARAFGDYFYARLQDLKGGQAGENFAAITDPGTPLVELAQERGFRRVFLNFPDIGGRYSALSYFGLVPAVLMGIDVSGLLGRALRMAHACSSCVEAAENPGLVLGAVMGELQRQGRDKVTFLMPEPIATLGMWLEQLLAESTGKEGKGLLPVADEPVGDPSVYGDDRLFVYLRLEGEVDPALEQGVAALQAAGQPVVIIRMDDRLDVGQEFFRWETATATAGAILKINPFDQPNVQESKDNTRRLLEVMQEKGQLPGEEPALVEAPLSVCDGRSASTVAGAMGRFLSQARPGDYVALMAYLTEDAPNDRRLQAIRTRLRDALHLATTVGYGPRFLHSTGQLHKGGPKTGLFLQLTADDDDDTEDMLVPGRPYTFGMLKQAQALGDLQALCEHGQRAMRIHLGRDVARGLAALEEAIEAALEDIS